MKTMADLASLGELEGRRVRLLEDVGSFAPAGSVGTVVDVYSSRRALVVYTVGERRQAIESPFSKLELVDGP